MKKLLKAVEKNRKGSIGKKIKKRLKEFSSFKGKPEKEWFSELCFCILTANSKGRTAYNIQKEIGADGFCTMCADDIKSCIMNHKHRFHNNKTKFIVEARKHFGLKKKIQGIVKEKGEAEAREWLAKNVKGFGYKEASHFLRNVGYFNLAILDRHILRLLKEAKLINEIPKSLSKKNYLNIEKDFLKLAEKAGMPPAELDMHMWFLRAGEVLK